jgi:hypothetical protein
MKLTGAAILVSHGIKALPAAPAAYPYRVRLIDCRMRRNAMIKCKQCRRFGNYWRKSGLCDSCASAAASRSSRPVEPLAPGSASQSQPTDVPTVSEDPQTTAATGPSLKALLDAGCFDLPAQETDTLRERGMKCSVCGKERRNTRIIPGHATVAGFMPPRIVCSDCERIEKSAVRKVLICWGFCWIVLTLINPLAIEWDFARLVGLYWFVSLPAGILLRGIVWLCASAWAAFHYNRQ